MKECERIIKDGILPESFFKEEIRSDFLVTTQRKKIWAIEIDLYLKFAEICKKHNLRFWGDGGTLLGAIRHNGFIPWDDDMDIIMPRADYDKLMDLSNEFEHPYFLQTPHTDLNYAYSFAKFRNSNTTCFPKAFAKAGFNHGIFIDIFPLDSISLATFENDKKIIRECALKNSSWMKRNSIEFLDERQLENFKKYQTEDPIKEYEIIQEISSNPQYIGSEYVANAVYPALESKAQIWKASWYKETIMHQFEMIELPIPKDFDVRLKTQYGDYMKLPPKESRGTWHSDIIWDPEKSYKEYLNI